MSSQSVKAYIPHKFDHTIQDVFYSDKSKERENLLKIFTDHEFANKAHILDPSDKKK